jgi:hypothetical protein
LWDCIVSPSRTLGIIVIGTTTLNPNIDYMIDGLQRFSAFTSVVHKIGNVLFTRPSPHNPNPWNLPPALVNRQSLANLQNIAAQHVGKRGRITYNYTALRLLRRQAVSQTYRIWCDALDD